MATETTNYRFKKPTENEFYDVGIQNQNWDAADEKLKNLDDDSIIHKADAVIHITAAERAKWNAVTNKVDKVSGKQLSTNDYTTAEKSKLSGIAAGAEVNVQADWNASAASDAFIKNKPASFPPSAHTHDDRYYTESETNTKLDTKVNAAGGDISATKVGSITASAASYPVPAANDTVKVGFGKIVKFFGDIRNWMTGVCLIGQIVNNCVTNNSKLPLSAAQGKALMDLFTQLNSDFDTKLRNELKKVPCRLDEETTEVIFYKSCGIVCVQLSFTLAWSINKDVSDMICTIPRDFIPSLNRFLTDNTFNSGKIFNFIIRKNTNDVMCLYLNAAEALVAGDTINTSFLYQLY